jgi:alpha-tubulin suppressor-like RCC1 family protein
VASSCTFTCSAGYLKCSNACCTATGVGAGQSNSCAITSAGGLKCWGTNSYGQVGDGTTTPRLVPTDVSGLSSGVAAVNPGYHHNCAVTTSGGAKCWGQNSYGQVGDGSLSTKYTPTDVSGLTSGVTAIATGFYHTCALTSAGGVKCWGYNTYGQLGDGTTTSKYTPTDVSGLTSGVIAISVGDYHSCAVTSAGGAKCWGYNASGRLGDSTTVSKYVPTDVTGLTSGVTAITASSGHTCAIVSGGAKCWGSNSYGQLGDGTTTGKTSPIDVSGLSSGVTMMASDGTHTCALTSAGAAKCWGYNYSGSVGDGTTINRYTPTDVVGLGSGVAAITAGTSHSCALTSGGAVKCWGYNGSGQLGIDSYTNKTTPTDVSGQ